MIAVVAVVGSLFVPAHAAGDPSAGPDLEADPVAMETALDCPDGLSLHPERPVILLVPGTGSSGVEAWGFGTRFVLHEAGFDWCMVELPGRATVDVQISSEYVVHAVRALHQRTGRKISLVGASQGAMEIRWAVRWWPDVRAAVDDLVTFVGANRGLIVFNLVFCSSGECIPASWQIAKGSAFLAALNRVPTPEGPSYTAIYSLTDELVQPSWPESQAAGAIDGASNVAIQDLCPGRIVGHVQSLFDAAFAAVLLDALEHPGAADLARIDRGVCREVFAPAINPAMATVALTTVYANALATGQTAPKTRAEPPLRPFARSG